MNKLILLGFLCSILTTQAVAQTGIWQEPLTRDTAVLTGQLANGLTYYIQHNNEPRNRAELRLVVKAGSLQEDADQLGIAHFVEHLAFNGTKHFAANELIDFLERMGSRFGPDLNAYTSFDRTVYQLQLRTDSLATLQQGVQILHDWADGLLFDTTEINKERGVVIAEWRSRLSAQQRLQQAYLPRLLRGSRYAERLPIGSPELIDTVAYATIQRFYRDWYRPDLMAVIAVGNFSPAWMEGEIIKQFSDLVEHAAARPRLTDTLPLYSERSYYLAADAEALYPELQLIYRFPKPAEDTTWGRVRRELLYSLYNRMLNERLYEIIQQPDPPFTFSSSGQGDLPGERSAYTISVATSAEKLEKGFSRILLETNRLRQHGFMATELERGKEKIRQQIGHAYRERDKRTSASQADGWVQDFAEEQIQPTIASYYQQLDTLLASVTLSDLNILADYWLATPDQFLLVTAPSRDTAALPTESRLWQLVDSTRATATTPYIDAVPQGNLGDKLLLPPVVYEKLPGDTVLAITHYQLANGIELWLKSTDFTDDRLQFTAFSPGGSSVLTDEEFAQATHLFAVMELSGVSGYTAADLEKLLAGKQVSVSPYLQDYYEGFSGSAAPHDLETLLQLLYLQATAPRFDTSAFAAYLDRNRAVLANAAELPNFQFAKLRREVLYQGHPRETLDPLGDIERLNLHEMEKVYRERFADFSDYVFVFAGRFDEDSLLNLTSRYLGNLPATQRQETWQDTGVRLAPYAVDTTFVGGETPKARIEMILHDTIAYTAANRYHFSSLQDLLRMRLREELREEQGAVYGVRIFGSISPQPIPAFRLTISFQAEPTVADELIASVYSIIKRIAAGEIDPDDVAKIKASQLKSSEEARRSDRYWLGQISTRLRYGISFDSMTGDNYATTVSDLTAADLQQAAQRFVLDATPVIFKQIGESKN